jgi:hypothetical protein
VSKSPVRTLRPVTAHAAFTAAGCLRCIAWNLRRGDQSPSLFVLRCVLTTVSGKSRKRTVE